MPSITVDLSPEIVAWLEFLKNDHDAADKANGLPPSATIEDEAGFQIQVAYMQACAAGRVPAEIRNDDIPF